MSEMSQYQNVFRITKSDIPNKATKSRTTVRNRQPVSCSACRKRKLKCDRQVPCMSCSKRGDVTSCNYSNRSQNERDRHDGGSRASEAHLRLQKLEEMVTILSKSYCEMSSPGPRIDYRSQNSSVPNSLKPLQKSAEGHLEIHGSETNYLGATHWVTILENIRDIQGVLGSDVDDNEGISAPAPGNGLEIVLSATGPLTLTDAYNSLPPRAIVDKLLSVYFNARYNQSPIIHSEKFLREYESFWVNPSSVSFLWLSTLFSALYIGSQINEISGQEVIDSLYGPARLSLLEKAAQALVTGRYQMGRPYSVDALLLYALCNSMKKEDPDIDAWMIMGISTRLAMRMGYHRDPRHLPNISPFESEMRRRVFFVVESLDILFSLQVGLPPIIHEEECDTEPPSNLYDTDFDENSATLPPSRPPTDPTPMLYWCHKGRLMKVLRRVSRHTLSIKTPLYENTMKLDGELRDAHADVPPSLRMRRLSLSFTDESYMILHRLNIDLLYLKTLCILHRNYLSYERSNATFDYSRKTCTDAALQILTYQAELHAACQPGGQFHNDDWLLSSLTLTDFLLAAMITCLDLYESYKRIAAPSMEDLMAQVRKYDALTLSRDIWTSRRASSHDARRASNVLAVMLRKVPRPNISSTHVDVAEEISTSSPFPRNGGEMLGMGETSSESSPWNTDRFDISRQELYADNFALSDFNSTDPLNAIFSNSENIDWGVIDQCLLGRGIVGGEIPFDLESVDNLGISTIMSKP